MGVREGVREGMREGMREGEGGREGGRREGGIMNIWCHQIIKNYHNSGFMQDGERWAMAYSISLLIAGDSRHDIETLRVIPDTISKHSMS